MNKITLLILALPLTLMFTGCGLTNNTDLASLNKALVGLNDADTIFTGTVKDLVSVGKITVADGDKYLNIAQTVDTALVNSLNELSSNDTTAVKLSTIGNTILKVSLPSLPAGVSPYVVVAYNTFETAFALFQNGFKTNAVKVDAHTVIKPSLMQSISLNHQKAKAESNSKSITAWKKVHGIA